VLLLCSLQATDRLDGQLTTERERQEERQMIEGWPIHSLEERETVCVGD
jgi:hypothetical protein